MDKSMDKKKRSDLNTRCHAWCPNTIVRVAALLLETKLRGTQSLLSSILMHALTFVRPHFTQRQACVEVFLRAPLHAGIVVGSSPAWWASARGWQYDTSKTHAEGPSICVELERGWSTPAQAAQLAAGEVHFLWGRFLSIIYCLWSMMSLFLFIESCASCRHVFSIQGWANIS